MFNELVNQEKDVKRWKRGQNPFFYLFLSGLRGLPGSRTLICLPVLFEIRFRNFSSPHGIPAYVLFLNFSNTSPQSLICIVYIFTIQSGCDVGLLICVLRLDNSPIISKTRLWAASRTACSNWQKRERQGRLLRRIESSAPANGLHPG